MARLEPRFTSLVSYVIEAELKAYNSTVRQLAMYCPFCPMISHVDMTSDLLYTVRFYNRKKSPRWVLMQFDVTAEGFEQHESARLVRVR